ncbi:CDP-6-deoxy-delta-3,4-glucoseen reductase [Rugosibacter aromaticivorans]|uniref:CDP-6-deoxy-delta-3,4-glucoseen reductase n=1 Tax=Rugosibacter aromaticivorans TaxID=1565605 RepID=A0A0C5JCY5_9PROT|nr:CDP-6-deoxy-delta-3,4-glucoseen reductase [Rugosibacter aromaticivorans]
MTLAPSARSFLTHGEDSLLQAALDAGFVLPYGCRNGACGSCKGKVLEGLVDHGDIQPGALSLADRAAGYTLLCCAKPLSDVVLECREVSGTNDIPVKTLPCRVEKIERVAEDVIVLSLKLPVNERLQFLAGQYIEFLLKNGKTRAFSIANAPHAEGLLELHIRHVVGGEFTSHLFSHMKEKEILRLRGPLGTFFLRETSDKPIIFVAGGTGFAPIKSIIEHVLHSGIQRPMRLYWGARNRAGLYLNDLPERWMAEQAGIHYVPVLSEPDAADQWAGRTGLVHQAVLEDQPTLATFQVYACGAPAMVDAAQRDFIAHGLPAEEFFSDAFAFTKATD